MYIISRRIHGILDYIVGLLLIIAPNIFGFEHTGAASSVPVALGIAAIVYSIVTNYELGFIKLLPFKTHLGLDLASGIFLAASPWLLHFSSQIYAPHLVVGLVEIVVVALTSTSQSLSHHPVAHL